MAAAMIRLAHAGWTVYHPVYCGSSSGGWRMRHPNPCVAAHLRSWGEENRATDGNLSPTGPRRMPRLAPPDGRPTARGRHDCSLLALFYDTRARVQELVAVRNRTPKVLTLTAKGANAALCLNVRYRHVGGGVFGWLDRPEFGDHPLFSIISASPYTLGAHPSFERFRPAARLNLSR